MLRMITKENENNENYEKKENYEILRNITKYYEKKGKMLLKNSRYRDILYCKCILFYTL